MPRVPLAVFEPALKKRLDGLWGTPPNLYRALANHPALIAAWTEFSRMLRYDTRTPRALRDIGLREGDLDRAVKLLLEKDFSDNVRPVTEADLTALVRA